MYFNQLWWRFAIIIVLSYAIGNFNSAITISKLKKRDIRTIGSGNPGTMNMSRNFGLKIGLLVFVLDILKGVVPTLIAKIWFSHLSFDLTGQPIVETASFLAMFFAVAGHVFPAAYKFKGGKGIATTIGAWLVCDCRFTVIFGIMALAFIFSTKIGSMGSFVATTLTAIASAIRLYFVYYVNAINNGTTIGYYIIANVIIFSTIMMTWFAHRVNIAKLMSGEEHDTDWWHMLKNAILKHKYKNKESV